MIRENRHIDLDEIAEMAAREVEEPRVADELIPPRQAPGEVTAPPRKRVRVKELIDGSFLVRENMIRQLPYLLFLTMLAVLYIGNRFHAERMVRQIDELKIEVGNLRSEQITITSELMNISRPSEVAALVGAKGLGLKESLEPPKKLKK